MKIKTFSILFCFLFLIALLPIERAHADTLQIKTSSISGIQKGVVQGLLGMYDQIKIKYTGKTFLTGANDPFSIANKTWQTDIPKNYKYNYYRNLSNQIHVNTSYMEGSPQMDITVTFKYLTTKKQNLLVQKEADRILKKIIKPGMSKTQKITAINDYLITSIRYDTSLQRRSDYEGLFGSKSTVCQGYSLLTQLMLIKSGIPSYIVTGTTPSGPHAWNLVKFSDGWHYTDVTFNDPVPDQGNALIRTYLKRSAPSLLKEGRTWDMKSYAKLIK